MAEKWRCVCGQLLTIQIERDRSSSTAGDRNVYRAKVRGADGGSMSGCVYPSIERTKREAERLFGPLAWTEPAADADEWVKAVARVRIG
jgi:hypothetical protein